jgi:hypothetical protein
MKPISEYIKEASINAKNRREQFAKSLFDIDSKNHKLFRTIGIITGENPDSTQQTPQVNTKLMNDFKKDLKRNNIAYIPIKGKFGGNTENTLLLINPTVETLTYYAGRFEQTSFFYCTNNNGKTVAEYWEKQDPTRPFDKKDNPYIKINDTDIFIKLSKDAEEYTIIGDDFKFVIDASVFDRVHESLEHNLNMLCESNQESAEYYLYMATNMTGQKASICRAKLYGNIE